MLSDNMTRDPMMDVFIFETNQMLEQLEQILIKGDEAEDISEADINEIFRIMHTIKGSSAMMMLNGISDIAHSDEDLFDYLRNNELQKINCSELIDIVLETIDFMKNEIVNIQTLGKSEGNSANLKQTIQEYLNQLKEKNNCSKKIKKDTFINEKTKVYKAIIFFEFGCEMENIRAYNVLHSIENEVREICYYPQNILEDVESVENIRKYGFNLVFKSEKNLDNINILLEKSLFLKELQLEELEDYEAGFLKIEEMNKNLNKIKSNMVNICDNKNNSCKNDTYKDNTKYMASSHVQNVNQQMISVNIEKLDRLMDLVGEIVISEAMVIQNPELAGIELNGFHKAARQLQKITLDLQDVVMSIRMVPLSTVFNKMNRLVRDMCKKTGKMVKLVIVGEETEVDKNIIEHISDPLMHIIRNSIDHGIEDAATRNEKRKSVEGKITLEAKNDGGDVLITVKDDGQGIDKQTILVKAYEKGLLKKQESEYSDKEIYSFIFLPGFSTNEQVTEFSGRGVGMDVVMKNIEKVGGTASVESKINEGTVISIKIPLTLAIIDGMVVKVGDSSYTIPLTSIKESFRGSNEEIIVDTEGNEFIMVRGKCYPIIRIHKRYSVKTKVVNIYDGIIMMVETNDNTVCIFVDQLIGQQQVVVKTLPSYIKKVKGIAGCTLLGDGSISLILDISKLIIY